MVNFEIAVHVEFQKGGGASRGVSMLRIREGGTDTLKRLPNFFPEGDWGYYRLLCLGPSIKETTKSKENQQNVANGIS